MTSTAGLAVAHPAAAYDDVDGLPIWTFVEGEELVCGCLAWERLGVGTRCETWLAWSVEMWAPVVVKLVRPHQVDHPRGLAAIAREADALGRVRHPAFPRLWSDGRTTARPHVVLEYVDGPDLDDVLDDIGPMDSADLVQLGLQVASALRALHTSGFAHLDLKPDNVAVRDARVTVLDLGSARPLGRSQPAGRPIGSAGYAAPDLEAGADISAAMDVYGLGVLLAEAALDDRLFDSGQAAEARPSVELDAAAVGADLAALVTAMLAPEPGDRPALADVLAGLDALTGPDRSWPRRASDHLSGRTEPNAPG